MPANDRVVIVDTSVVQYSVQLDQALCLHHLYGQITLPGAVYNELTHSRTPALLKQWILEKPSWVRVLPVAPFSDPALDLLDSGEREAIALAEQIPGSLLVIDDFDGRKEARKRGIPLTGLLGIVRDAAASGFLEFESAIQKLRNLGFRLSAEVESTVRLEYRTLSATRTSSSQTP